MIISTLNSKMSDESIGMMDKAYFVGKVVIIQWLNELLGVSAAFWLTVIFAATDHQN